MTVIFGIVGGLIALNTALVVALLVRRDRPEAREKLFAWVVKGGNATKRHRHIRAGKAASLGSRRS
jgi:hypothetical protein